MCLAQALVEQQRHAPCVQTRSIECAARLLLLGCKLTAASQDLLERMLCVQWARTLACQQTLRCR